MENYSWFKNHESCNSFTVVHKQSESETIIAITYDAEKADFIAKACNQFSLEQYEASQKDLAAKLAASTLAGFIGFQDKGDDKEFYKAYSAQVAALLPDDSNDIVRNLISSIWLYGQANFAAGMKSEKGYHFTDLFDLSPGLRTVLEKRFEMLSDLALEGISAADNDNARKDGNLLKRAFVELGGGKNPIDVKDIYSILNHLTPEKLYNALAYLLAELSRQLRLEESEGKTF